MPTTLIKYLGHLRDDQIRYVYSFRGSIKLSHLPVNVKPVAKQENRWTHYSNRSFRESWDSGITS